MNIEFLNDGDFFSFIIKEKILPLFFFSAINFFNNSTKDGIFCKNHSIRNFLQKLKNLTNNHYASTNYLV